MKSHVYEICVKETRINPGVGVNIFLPGFFMRENQRGLLENLKRYNPNLDFHSCRFVKVDPWSFHS